MKNDIRRTVTILFAALCFIAAVFPAFALDPENGTGISYQPVRKVDLGVPSLTLEPGEKYTFSVSLEPDDTPVTRLTWFNTDNTVAALNQLTNTVTALTPGTARLMAESFDGEAWAVCEIMVNGTQEKDLSGMVEGKSLLTLSEADRAKIEASQINRRLDLLEMSVINEEAFQKLQNQDIEVIAEVQPGTEDAESERALAHGMSVAYPMRYLHLVSLHGSIFQILEFVKSNDDLIRIFKEPDVYFFDPLPETGTSSSEPKTAAVNYTTKLEGKVEELTSVSVIHNFGYTGKGITIAIIDSGLNSSHEQFAGRVVAENCFSNSYRWKLKEGCQPCDEKDKDCDIYKCYLKEDFSACKGGAAAGHGTSYSAFPGGAVKPWRFNHGSHVAGIAAGKDGMAPGANIVAVQVQSEIIDPEYISVGNPDGYLVTMNNEDVLSAYDWVLGLQDKLKKEGKPVSILNLSLGGGRFDETCDTQSGCEDHFSALTKLNKAEILVVASSGNQYYEKALIMPACLSNVMAVGALAAMDEPYITASSNHSPLVDILAPGTDIRSAFLVNDAGQPVTDHYGKLSGTSMAAPAVSGSLALLMEAYPGLGLEEYKPMLMGMSSKTANRRISIDGTVDDTGTVFEYTKPVLDFSKFQKPGPQDPEPPYPHIDIFDLHVMPKTGFSAVRPQNLSEKPLSVQYQPTRLTLQLPTLDVVSEIVSVLYTESEYPVEWLGTSVGMLEGSSLPGEGVTILTGHNHLNTTEAGPFALLSSLGSGDSIMITDSRGVMRTWQVYKSAKIPADGFSRIAGDVKENALVLITCEDESPEGSYLNRRVVLAEKQ